MPDYIKGSVQRIIDEETFSVAVEFVGNTNKHEYEDFETIRIKKLDPPYLKGIEREKWKQRLEKKLLNQTVYCYLLNKGLDGVFSARVECSGPHFRRKKNHI